MSFFVLYRNYKNYSLCKLHNYKQLCYINMYKMSFIVSYRSLYNLISSLGNIHIFQVQQAQSEAQPQKKIEVTEEDRITLKPIGPGVQQLEPEGSHTGTLGRESTTSTLGRTTPSFPTPIVSAGKVLCFTMVIQKQPKRPRTTNVDEINRRQYFCLGTTLHSIMKTSPCNIQRFFSTEKN